MTINRPTTKSFGELLRTTILFMLWFSVSMVFFAERANAVTKTSTGTGAWNTAGSWSPSGVPANGDDVIIAVSHTISVDTDTANLASISISGTLTIGVGIPDRIVTVSGPITINASGTLNTAGNGGNNLRIGGNLTNNGTFDLNIAGATAITTFDGTTNQSVTGTGTTTDFSGIVINNTGAAGSNTVDFAPSTFTVPADFLTLTDGIFKLSSGSTLTFNANLTIGSAVGFVVNHASAVINILDDDILVSGGDFQALAGTLNIGNGDDRFSVSGGTAALNGGSLNINGRFDMTGGTTTISGAIITIDPQGTANLGLSIHIFEATGAANLTFSSGTVVIVDPHAATGSGNAVQLVAGGTKTFSAASTIQFGNGTSTSSGSIDGFDVNSGSGLTLGSLVVNNPSGSNREVRLVTNNCTLAGTLTVTAGIFDQGALNLSVSAISVANAGTLRNLSTGDLTLGATGVSNAGTINYNGGGTACGDADSIVITSALPGTPWNGTGTFSMTDVAVSNQAGTVPILVNSGTNTGPNGPNWLFINACTGNTYTWIGGLNADWQIPTNWTPTRASAASAVTTDQLIFDFDVTPAPTVTNVPSQQIASLDLVDGVAVKLNAQTTPGTKTLTINGGAANDLTVPLNNSLTLQGTTGLVISLSNNSTGSVGGVMIVEDGPHQLLAAGSTVSFIGTNSSNLARFTTDTDYDANTNPFGSGVAGNGSTNSIIFGAFSVYTHNAGGSPFGAVGSGPNVDFQTGSEADILNATNFQAANRKYATLVIGSGTIPVNASDSGSSGNFQFTSLVINHPGANSSLVFIGSGTSTVTIKGNITSSDAGAGTFADVTLSAGSGGIQIAAGGTATFGNQFGSHGILFDSDATVVSGTTLNLSRLLQMGLSANGIVTDNGAIVPNFSAPGYVIGAVRKPTVPASYVFPVGLIGGYTPVELSNATGGGDLTVKAVDAPTSHPSVADATSLDEYWTLTLNSGTLAADLKFTYLDPDVDGIEANYKIVRIDGADIVHFPLTNLDTVNNTATIAGIEHFSDWTLAEPVGATAVKFGRFNAASYADGVQLTWDSGFEVNNLGYHVYREQNGKRTRVTPSVVAGSALRVGRGAALNAGYSYAWFDPQGTPNTSYHLEAIDLDGSRQWAGPIYPYAGNSGRPSPRQRAKLLKELITSASAPNSTLVKSWPAAMKAANAADLNVTGSSLAVQRAIAAGKAVKISVRENGWYRITQADLVAAGFDPSTDARMLQLFVDGEEVPMSLSTPGTRLNNNDVLEFYGVPLDTPTTDTRVYWLISGDSAGKRMIARRGKLKQFNEDVDPELRSFEVTVERRDKIVYFPNLLNGDHDNLFGAPIFSDPLEQTVAVNNLSPDASTHPELEVAIQGLTDGGHGVHLKLNGTSVGTMSLNGNGHAVAKFAVDPALLHEGDNVVTLNTTNGDSDISLVDGIRLTYQHQYKAINNSLRFTAPAGRVVQVDGFTVPNIRVVDITDPSAPMQLSAMATSSDGGYAVKIQTTGSGARTLIAFTEEQSRQPVSMSSNQPSMWNAAANGADMLIVTHKDFRNAIEPLANLRRSQGMVVAVVDVEDVYDEFSYGAHTPDAVKSFLMTAASGWQRKPQYLLLVGDSSWDPRDYLGEGANDFVPTKLIDTQSMETASDDWLADFDGFGLPDLAVGRLPGRTAAEVGLMVSKIMTYEQERELNSPLRGALMVADNGFESQSLQTGNLLPAGVTVQSINRSTVQNDDVMRGQLLDALNQGPMIVNYYGHGSVTVWTGAGLLDSDLVSGLTNANRPSVYVMMTCLNGYASDAYIDSLGEASLKAQNGAVAVWASSGFTTPQPQFAMNSEFYRLLFGSQPMRLGEAARSAKAATQDRDVRRTWVLLGDPAMRIR